MSEDDDEKIPRTLERFLDQIIVDLDSAAARAVVAGMNRKLFLRLAGYKFDWIKNMNNSEEDFDVDDEHEQEAKTFE